MMRLYWAAVVVVCLTCAGSVLGGAAPDGKTVWKDVLRKCASSDLIGGDVLYVGPTNTFGLGSIWRKASGAWRPQREFDATAAPDAIRQSAIKPGNPATCVGDSKTSSSINPTLVLQSLVAPFGVDLGVDLKKAKTVSVQVKGYTWDTILEDVFVKGLPKFTQEYREALRQRSVVGRVLRVNDIEAELTFDNATKASLQAKYKAGIEATAGLKGEWTGAGTLKMTASNASFLAIQLWKFEEAGFKSGSELHFFKPVPLVATDKVLGPVKTH